MVEIEKVALALSDSIRLHILDLLVAGRTDACCSPANPGAPLGLCSCDLLPTLDLAASRLSYHMAQLKEAGLVSEQKRGKWVYYTVNHDVLEEFQQALKVRFSEPCCSPTASWVKLELENPQ